eukprot:COSAG02_NODE_988_length_15440_cov_5.979271_8_plen_187_part_00
MAGAAGAEVGTETAPAASQADSASGASTSSPGAAVKETGGGNATDSAAAVPPTTSPDAALRAHPNTMGKKEDIRDVLLSTITRYASVVEKRCSGEAHGQRTPRGDSTDSFRPQGRLATPTTARRLKSTQRETLLKESHAAWAPRFSDFFEKSALQSWTKCDFPAHRLEWNRRHRIQSARRRVRLFR